MEADEPLLTYLGVVLDDGVLEEPDVLPEVPVESEGLLLVVPVLVEPLVP
jgi:hypothetical protein